MPIQDLIGKESPEFQVPIEWGKIREFAAAIGDENPIYHDPEYARKTKFGKTPAPPTFTVIKSFWRKGLSNQEMAGLDNRYVLHGEEEYEYFAPILAGDVLTCKARVSDAYEKAGKRGGKMTFVVFEFMFFNQRGEKVLVSRSTLIQTGGVVKE
jgi:acyl dehydratase